MGERHRHHLRDGDHLVHLVQRHDPVVGADLEAQLRGEGRPRRGRADALGDGELELAKAGAARHA
jgi:hypothetical protein